MSRIRFLVDMFMAMRTFLLCERPLFAIRVFRAVPFLVFVKACAVELALAVSTDAAQLKLGLWGSRPTLLTSARRVPMVRVAAVLRFLSARSCACQ